MSRRKDAARVEAIIRGILQMVALVFLFLIVASVPQAMKGKDPSEAISVLLSLLGRFVALVIALGVIGLLIRFWVIRRKRNEKTSAARSLASEYLPNHETRPNPRVPAARVIEYPPSAEPQPEDHSKYMPKPR